MLNKSSLRAQVWLVRREAQRGKADLALRREGRKEGRSVGGKGSR
jgi:hypothetical protein